jgi:hypothetical protein
MRALLATRRGHKLLIWRREMRGIPQALTQLESVDGQSRSHRAVPPPVLQ